MDYYNTLQLCGYDLAKARKKVKGQDSYIMAVIFEANREMAPDKVLDRLIELGQKWPITSVRRAMTNLTNEGFLVKTDNKVMGMYGHLTYTWKLSDKYRHNDQPQGELF